MNDYGPARSEERSNLILGCCSLGRICWKLDSNQKRMRILVDARECPYPHGVPKKRVTHQRLFIEFRRCGGAERAAAPGHKHLPIGQ
jgi:hypothetical protein